VQLLCQAVNPTEGFHLGNITRRRAQPEEARLLLLSLQVKFQAHFDDKNLGFIRRKEQTRTATSFAHNMQ
jgi:hypothetical protein